MSESGCDEVYRAAGVSRGGTGDDARPARFDAIDTPTVSDQWFIGASFLLAT